MSAPRQAPGPARGIFITVEGIDGSGKSTQARALALWLRERGREVVLTREPGGTTLGESLRALVLDDRAPVGAAAELLLYGADRAQHVEEVIRPAVESGHTVVCERFADSTAAYQGRGRGLDAKFVQALNRFATGGLEPDLTVLLELTPAVARERLAETPDRLEREAADFHRRVAQGYRELARAHPQRIKVVDATGAVEEVSARAVQVLQDFLSARADQGGPW
jgi:dTMP kinase